MSYLKPFRGIQLNKTHPLARGLVGCWLMNENGGDKVFDLSGDGYTGIITTPTWIPGGLDIGNVHNKSIILPNISARCTNAITMVTSLRTGDVAYSDRICTNYDGTDYDLILGITTALGNGFRFVVYTTTAVTEDDNEGGALADNTNYVLAGVYNGVNVTIYKNGKKAGGTPPTQTGNLVGRNQAYYIGTDGSGSPAVWNGYIYWQMVWNRAVSAAEIAWLYREPFAIFNVSQRQLLAVIGAISLAGTAQAVATPAGSLSVKIPLAGTAQAVATPAGSLSVRTTLAGIAQAVATPAGSLSVKIPLAGTAQAVATPAGMITISGETTLAGIAQAVATPVGSLSVKIPLAGNIAATTTISGNLTISEGLISNLFGSIQINTTIEGDISRILSLYGEISVSASIYGEIAGATVSLRGISTGLVYTQGMLGALKGLLILLWIPTAEEGTSNILDWVWPYPEPSEYLAPIPFMISTTPGFSLFETDVDSMMPICFRNDFYYRIHITPNPINLGAIMGDMSIYVTVWNSYFVDEILEDIIKTGDTMIVVDPVLPFTFLPLWWEEIEFQIPGDGPPSFSAEVDFDFGIIDALPVEISGNRVALLYWRLQTNIKETLSSKTNILQASDGTEQRIKIRLIPRQMFQLKLILEDYKNATIYDALLHKWQKRAWAIPIWQEYVNHSSTINSADLVVYVNTTNADFRDDSFALIWKSNTEYIIVEIETKTDSQLNLKTKVGATIVGDKLIMPLRIANMISRSQKKLHNTGVSEITANFLVVDNINIEGYIAGTTYDGFEVITTPSFIDPTILESSEADILVSDFDTGLVEVLNYSEFNQLNQSHIWYNDNRADCWKFRKFLHSKHGCQVPFLVPTFRRDLKLTDNVNPSDNMIYVENVGLAINMGLNSLRTYIGFIVGDSLYIRKITNIIRINSTKEQINIDAVLGFSIDVGEDKICFVDKVRFFSDDISIDWIRTNKNECRTSLLRIK